MPNTSNMPIYEEQGSGVSRYAGGGSQEFVKVGTITLAQLNAGASLIDPVPGRTLTITGGRIKMNGSFSTLTAAVIAESDGSPAIATYAQAQMADGTVFDLNNTATGQTIGTGFAVALTKGNGVSISKTGSAATVGTSIDYVLRFTVD